MTTPTLPARLLAFATSWEAEGNAPQTVTILREAAAALSVPSVPALDVFRIAGGDVECSRNPSAKLALDTLIDLRQCYDELLATSQPGDGWVLVPVRLPADAVSGIKDILESDYDMPSVKARPLWASLLEIVAGLSIEEQEAINEARASLHATNAAAPSAKGV